MLATKRHERAKNASEALSEKAKHKSASPQKIETNLIWHGLATSVMSSSNEPQLQAKLTVGGPNDKYEKEADRLADLVMRMLEPREDGELGIQRKSEPVPVQRMCTGCEEELQRQPMEEDETIRAKTTSGRTLEIKSTVQAKINGLRGCGQPLPESERDFFEPRFGYNFSGVRVHTDFGAASVAEQVNARAFTVGRDVVFGAGKYAPGTVRGRHLLAHELTHVAQQSRKGVNLQRQPTAEGLDEFAPGFQTPGVGSEQSQPVTLEGKPGCDGNMIVDSIIAARGQVDKAIDRLAIEWGEKGSKARRIFGRHFVDVDNGTMIKVISVLLKTSLDLEQAIPRVSCAPRDDPGCIGAGAFYRSSTGEIEVCPSFFKLGTTERISNIIHEYAHANAPNSYPIGDEAYRGERVYRYLSTDEALRNAESYAALVFELTTGKDPLPAEVKDEFSDCPAGWRYMIRWALARAMQWNRMALMTTRAADGEKQIKDAAVLEKLQVNPGEVKKAFIWLKATGNGIMQIQCDEDSQESPSFDYGDKELRVCKPWRKEFYKNKFDASESLLAGLYGHRSHAHIARILARRVTKFLQF